MTEDNLIKLVLLGIFSLAFIMELRSIWRKMAVLTRRMGELEERFDRHEQRGRQ